MPPMSMLSKGEMVVISARRRLGVPFASSLVSSIYDAAFPSAGLLFC